MLFFMPLIIPKPKISFKKKIIVRSNSAKSDDGRSPWRRAVLHIRKPILKQGPFLINSRKPFFKPHTSFFLLLAMFHFLGRWFSFS
jgi:hypothetical protein